MNPDTLSRLDSDLISLAYTLAVEPQRLEQMIELLDTRLEHHLDDDMAGETNIDLAEDLVDHFDRAMSLLDRHAPNNSQAKSSMKFMEFDYQPSATIRTDGVIEYANQSAYTSLGWKSGERVEESPFDAEEFERFLEGLSRLEATPHDQFIGLYRVTKLNKSSSDGLQIALSASVNTQGEIIGRLSTIHLKIAPEIAEEFKSSLGLTNTEFAITQGLVTGQSVAEIADARGRSLATVRTQVKSLLAKLNLRSQVELACFYSGFAQFSVQRRQKNLTVVTDHVNRKTAIFERPDGRQVSYDIVGPASGRPVMYFHALGGGTGITQDVYKELTKHNIKLIMPWRPYFDDTSPITPLKNGPDVFAKDILALMDALKIDMCPFLTNVSGTIWAYVAAAYCGERVPYITVTAGAVPVSNAQLKMIDFRQRSSIQVARHAPKLLPFAMRAAVAKIDAGFDQEFMLEHYESSPLDQDFLKSEEMISLNRAAHIRTTKQGFMPLVQELHHMARKWDHIMHRVTCPVTILQGAQDPSFPPGIVQEAIRNRPNFTLKIVPAAAQLLLFQTPEIVFEVVGESLPG